MCVCIYIYIYIYIYIFFFFFSLPAQLVRNPPAMQETLVQFLVGKILWRRDRLPTPVFLGFPGGSDSKESACNVSDLGSIPGLGRSPGEEHGNPLQYSCLDNPHGQRTWRATVHGVAKSRDTTEQLALMGTHYVPGLEGEHKSLN